MQCYVVFQKFRNMIYQGEGRWRSERVWSRPSHEPITVHRPLTCETCVLKYSLAWVPRARLNKCWDEFTKQPQGETWRDDRSSNASLRCLNIQGVSFPADSSGISKMQITDNYDLLHLHVGRRSQDLQCRLIGLCTTQRRANFHPSTVHLAISNQVLADLAKHSRPRLHLTETIHHPLSRRPYPCLASECSRCNNRWRNIPLVFALQLMRGLIVGNI